MIDAACRAGLGLYRLRQTHDLSAKLSVAERTFDEFDIIDVGLEHRAQRVHGHLALEALRATSVLGERWTEAQIRGEDRGLDGVEARIGVRVREDVGEMHDERGWGALGEYTDRTIAQVNRMAMLDYR